MVNRDGNFKVHLHGKGDILNVEKTGTTIINSHNLTHIPLVVSSHRDAHIMLKSKNDDGKNVSLVNRDGNFVIHKNGKGDNFRISSDGNIGGLEYVYVNRHRKGGIVSGLGISGHRNHTKIREENQGGHVKKGCPHKSNHVVICPKEFYMVGLTESCGGYYPICKRFN